MNVTYSTESMTEGTLDEQVWLYLNMNKNSRIHQGNKSETHRATSPSI